MNMKSNFIALGITFKQAQNNNIELLNIFEVFEHFSDPVSEIEKMFKLNDTIIFSTQLLPNPMAKPGEWWHYAFDHGQHVSFYSIETLNKLAVKFNLNIYSFGTLHLLTKKKLNLNKIKLYVKLSKMGLFLYVRKMMKSKTWDNHILLENRGK